MTHVLSRADARRIAVRAQRLDAERPADLAAVVSGLTYLQDDRTAAVAPSADLVAWSRLGSSSPRDAVADAVEERSLIDLHGLLRPAVDLALFRAGMALWPGPEPVPAWAAQQHEWLEANAGFRHELLAELRRDGPLPQSQLPTSCDVPWRSSGWNNNRNLPIMLEVLVHSGDVAAAGRDGRDRLWDLASRVYPDAPIIPAEEALRVRAQRRLAARGILRPRGPGSRVEPADLSGVGEPAVVEGVPGEWRVDPEYLGGTFTGRTAIISPLDQLVFDRKRMVELFDFDYQLEMYKPAVTRRWGYWAMPILHGDRLVGKVDATSDLDRGVLEVTAIHQDQPFDATLSKNVTRELRDLASWLGLELRLPS